MSHFQRSWFLFKTSFGVIAVAGHFYRGALYLYAVDGQAPAPFDTSMRDAAWRRRGQ